MTIAVPDKPWVVWGLQLRDLQRDQRILGFAHVGSTYTLGVGRDIDFAVLATPETPVIAQPTWLVGEWTRETNDAYESPHFVSYRSGVYNLIVMWDRGFFERYVQAMEVCKLLQIKTRREHVLVCRVVRDGWTAEQATSVDVPGEQD